jgi:hypothetical protein
VATKKPVKKAVKKKLDDMTPAEKRAAAKKVAAKKKGK